MRGLLPVLVGFLTCAALILGGVLAWNVREQRRLENTVDQLTTDFYKERSEWESIRKTTAVILQADEEKALSKNGR